MDLDLDFQIVLNFIELCLKGDLLLVQQCIQRNPNIDNEVYDIAFYSACCKGHLQVAQWLLEVHPSINIFESAFRTACGIGHLELAQWLLQVCPTINISADNDKAFREACNFGYLTGRLEVAQWLHSLKPYLYVIEYDENGKYKDYYIRTKEEANWEKRKYLVWLASDKCPEENKTNLLYKLPSDVSRMVIGFV